MVGRSSRSRGVCEATLFVETLEKPVQVVERLRRQGLTSLQELERLLYHVERKCKDANLLKALKE